MAFLAALAACDGGSPSAPRPAQLQAASTTTQTGVTEAPLPAELVAKVTDGRGRGLSGVAVAWSVAAGGGMLSAASTQTDAVGEARVRWTLGAAAGTFQATATVAGLPPVSFSATAQLPRPARVEVVAGNGQVGAPAGPLADSLVVRVLSAEGRPVGGVAVTWGVSGGGGALSAATATTDAAGIAKAAWTLGAAGPNAATASVADATPAAFAAFAVPVAAVTLSPLQPVVVRGDSLRLTAVARDSAGNVLAGRAVTWTTSAPGAVTVSPTGVVKGVGRGRATITATSEGRSSSVPVVVAQRPPRITGLVFSPNPVDVSTADATLDVLVTAVADAGMAEVTANVVPARGDPPGNSQRQECRVVGSAPIAGTSEAGTWRCPMTLPRGAAAGTWSMAITVIDSAVQYTGYMSSDLAAEGLPGTFQVTSANEDVTAPTLTSLTVRPSPLPDGALLVEFFFTATDGGTGMKIGATGVWPPSGGNGFGCSTEPQGGAGRVLGSFWCAVAIPAGSVAGAWTVQVTVFDNVLNSRYYASDDLRAAGLPYQVIVTR